MAASKVINNEKAKAVVTQYGCMRGKSFEGYDCTAGKDGAKTTIVVSSKVGNSVNPMTGSEAQQTRKGSLRRKASES
jgi:hypothetical protein